MAGAARADSSDELQIEGKLDAIELGDEARSEDRRRAPAGSGRRLPAQHGGVGAGQACRTS
jgi:hypothetical protein